MTTVAEAVLDQATIDQLTPPCDLPRNGAPCPDTAAWIVWITSPILNSPKLLACHTHKQAAEDHNRRCRSCHLTRVIFHADPLK